jgi:hypothetical protein
MKKGVMQSLMFSIVLVMGLLLSPVVLADDGNDDHDSDKMEDDKMIKNDRSGSSDRLDSVSDTDKVRQEVKTKAEAKRREDGLDIRREAREIVDAVKEDRPGSIDDVRKLATGAREIAERTVKGLGPERRVEILKKEIFENLDEEQRSKIKSLRVEKIEKLSDLREDHFEKLKIVDKERLRVITSEDGETLERIAEFEREDLDKLATLDRIRMKEVSKLSKEEAKIQLEKIKIVKATENFKLRPLDADVVMEKKEAFVRIKVRAGEIEADYREKIERSREAKDRLRSCNNKEGEESAECDGAREDAILRARETALNAVDRIVNHLEKLKEKVEGSENTAEDVVSDRVAKIDELIVKASELKIEIGETTTKKEINDVVKELRKLVNEVKKRSHRYSQGLLIAEIRGVVHRSEVMEKNLDCAVSGLEEDGVDTTSVDVKIDAFSSSIGDVRDKLSRARGLLRSEDDGVIEKGKSLVREARDMIKEAHLLLQEIRKDVGDLGGESCHKEQDVVIEDDEVDEE